MDGISFQVREAIVNIFSKSDINFITKSEGLEREITSIVG